MCIYSWVPKCVVRGVLVLGTQSLVMHFKLTLATAQNTNYSVGLEARRNVLSVSSVALG